MHTVHKNQEQVCGKKISSGLFLLATTVADELILNILHAVTP